MTARSGSTDPGPPADVGRPQPTRWVGWIVFAAIMLVLSGMYDIIWGVVAITRDEVFLSGPRGNVIDLDYTAWGWITLLVGVIVLLAGLSLVNGAIWASLVALMTASVSAVTNLLVIASYPVWTLMVITLDILVIYAITVHGDELRRD